MNVRTDQVAAQLRSLIADGTYKPGDPIPSVRALMAEYGINSYATMNRIIRDLANDGLLDAEHGKGTYVRRRKPKQVLRNPLATLLAEYERAADGREDEGIFELSTGEEDVQVDVTYSHDVPANEQVAEALQVEPGTSTLRRTFTYMVGGMPHQILHSYLTEDTAAAAGLFTAAAERKGRGTMAQLRAAGVIVTRARFVLGTRPTTALEREALAVPVGTSVFEQFRTMLADVRPVEFSTGIVPGDRIAYLFEVDLRGDRP